MKPQECMDQLKKLIDELEQLMDIADVEQTIKIFELRAEICKTILNYHRR